MNSLRAFVSAAVRWCLRHPLGRSQWIALGVWLAALAAGMLALGEYVALTTNRDADLYDQGAYLMLAEKCRAEWWPAATDGTRNPLLPWLLAKTASGARDTMLAAGLKLNVRLAALLAILLGAWAGRRVAWLPAVTFSTLGGLGVLLPIATFLGTEVLFYGLFFAAWMLAFALLARLTLARCALLGAVLALAYLAKPGVTLFCAALAPIAFARWIFRDDAAGWGKWRPLAAAALGLAIGAPMVLPRLLDSQRQFGDPLQNTAANCFWEENWDACLPKLAYLNPRLAYRLAPGEWPSARRYLDRNGLGGAWTRLTRGMSAQLANVVSADPKGLWFSRSPSAKRPVRRIFPYRGLFLLPPLVLASALAVAAVRREGPATIGKAARYQAAFAVLLTALSFGAFSWYWVIAPGSRFVMALYLPVLASALLASEALRRRLAAPWADALSAGTWAVMLGIFLVHVGIIASHPVFEKVRGAF